MTTGTDALLDFGWTDHSAAAHAPATTLATVTAASTPDLRHYDRILVNSSAGKDSQASLDVVACAAQAAGVLDRVVVVRADLGDAEWDGVPELAAEHAATTACGSNSCAANATAAPKQSWIESPNAANGPTPHGGGAPVTTSAARSEQ